MKFVQLILRILLL